MMLLRFIQLWIATYSHKTGRPKCHFRWWLEVSVYIIFISWKEKAMATHSSTLAWEIPWTEEPGRLQSMGSLRVRHDWTTSLLLSTFIHWRRKWQPTPVFLPGESQDRGAWWAAVYGIAQSRTWLTCLNSRSSVSWKPAISTNQGFSFSDNC